MTALKRLAASLRRRPLLAKLHFIRQAQTARCEVLLVALALTACTACRGPSSPPALSPLVAPDNSFSTNSTQLREGDVIKVTFENATNLNAVQTIPFDGIIALPLIEPIKAAGKTIADLESTLTVLYKPQIKTSEIRVARLSSAATYSIGGAVLKPGKFPLDRPITVLEAVMEAGGVDHARAKLSEVSVLRIENQQRVNHRVNLKRALQGRETNLFYLKPFDIIFVPEKTFNF
jgi:polysaccharide export outer membrane protein